jgi:hypothetical protein
MSHAGDGATPLRCQILAQSELSHLVFPPPSSFSYKGSVNPIFMKGGINSIAKPATHQATTIYKFKSATKRKSTFPYHFSIFYLDDSTVANIYSGLCVCAPLAGHRIGR